MAKRFIDTSKYRQAWRKLDPRFRAAYAWLTENCDAAGFWEIDTEHFRFECGYALDVPRFVAAMAGAVARHGAKKLRLVDFIEVNYGTLKEGYNPHKPAFRALHSSLNEACSKLEEEDEEEDTSSGVERAKIKEAVLWPSFSDFWEAYEKKGNRKTSAQKWDRLDQSEREAIMAYVPAYIASKPEKKFRKDGERFLEHRVWEDEIINTTNDGTKGPTLADQYAAIDRIAVERWGA